MPKKNSRKIALATKALTLAIGALRDGHITEAQQAITVASKALDPKPTRAS
jgi:hypothetical protein